MSKIKYFPEDMDVQNKTVILRLDLNVPLNEKKILDNSRILTSLPFLKNLIKKKAKIIIISHLGRPKGVKINELSLTPIYKFLKPPHKSESHHPLYACWYITFDHRTFRENFI